jgi:glycosyltransferase involved in cell wall biosynthesis
LIVKIDASLRSCPRNLFKLKCPKVLIVGDTHHMGYPLERVIRYALSEPFTHIILDHTRNHAHFLMEAGLKNVHWIPAVDFSFLRRELCSEPGTPLTFVGQVGRHHPFRRYALDSVRNAGLPLEILRGSNAKAADIYADSQITLNVSLNGDLNLRVFESLGAGGFLLTDRLSPASGLSRIFEDGKHLVTWGSVDELIEKIRYYLVHPEEAAVIRRTGQDELITHHSPAVKMLEVFDLVYRDKVNPRYDLECERASLSVRFRREDINVCVRERFAAYQVMQEAHRTNLGVTVWCENPAALASLADLPRLRFESVSAMPDVKTDSRVDFIWLEGTEANAVSCLSGRYVKRLLLPKDPSKALKEMLGKWGYQADAACPAHYRLRSPVALLSQATAESRSAYISAHLADAIEGSCSVDECLTCADLADTEGLVDLNYRAIERAVGLDRHHFGALISMAAASLRIGDSVSTLIYLEELRRIGPLPDEALELYNRLSVELVRLPELNNYYQCAGLLPIELSKNTRKILLVTNLFPPEELGGYGRKMWEFANYLKLRGHIVQVLASTIPSLAKMPNSEELALESAVFRTLRLKGTWVKGLPKSITDPVELMACDLHNRNCMDQVIRELQPDLVFAGNLDFLGVSVIESAFAHNLPVLQALGNRTPGYRNDELPMNGLYWIGSCSQWNAKTVQSLGYRADRFDVIYPGARVDRFFNYKLPDIKSLRICFAGLVMPFKGVHTLVEALAHLTVQGIDFTCEIAGECTTPALLKTLKNLAAAHCFADRLTFSGFLDRVKLGALFARNNVLVFPSIVEEGFGISQVEAMASGLVVISSGTGGAREIITDGVDGLLFPAGDPVALANRLIKLHEQPELFTSLQASGQKRAFALSIPRSGEKIEDLMEQICFKDHSLRGCTPPPHVTLVSYQETQLNSWVMVYS